jgi:hypothetical protein
MKFSAGEGLLKVCGLFFVKIKTAALHVEAENIWRFNFN